MNSLSWDLQRRTKIKRKSLDPMPISNKISGVDDARGMQISTEGADRKRNHQQFDQKSTC
jgi:hypothetical protein